MSMNKSLDVPSSGTIDWDTTAYTTAETDIGALMAALGLDTENTSKAVYVYCDMTEVAADAAAGWTLTVSIYVMIDGTNYVLLDADDYTKAEIVAEPIVGIYILKMNNPVKVTFTFDVAQATDSDIPWESLVQLI